jgi:hypothetical protein
MLKYWPLFIFIANIATAQIEPISTDRPDQTECSNIVPIGYFQMESGFAIENNKVNSLKSQEITYFTSLLKYGITKRFEIRVIIENSKITTKSIDINQNIKGFNPVQIGFKANLIHAKGWAPETSLIAHIGLPKLASSDKKRAKRSVDFRFTMQHQFTEKAALAYNFGAEYDGDSENATALYTVCTSRYLSKKIGVYIELYGFISKNISTKHNIDGGFTFPIKEKLLFDISASHGITASANNNYISLGFSFRLPK